MEKPFDIKVQETREEIYKILDESKLPISVCAMLMNEIRNYISIELSQNILIQKKVYEDSLKGSDNNAKDAR